MKICIEGQNHLSEQTLDDIIAHIKEKIAL